MDIPVAQAEAETQDEIEQIMSEIEELQQEMNSAANAKPPEVQPARASQAAAMSAVSTPIPTQTQTPPPVSATPDMGTAQEPPSSSVPGAEESTAALSDLEQEILKDFAGDGNEPWLEETLSTLQGEESSGKGVLDDLTDPVTAVSPVPSPEMLQEDSDEFELESEAEKVAVEKLVQTGRSSSLERGQNRFRSVQQSSAAQLNEKDTPQPRVRNSNSLTQTSSLAMTVQGKMELKLYYGSDGQEISVYFNDETIRVSLSDGTELCIPARKRNSKAA